MKPRAHVAMLRFATVGACGVGVNLAVVTLLHGLAGLRFVLASALATEVAILTNYVGNELWTFHVRRLHTGRLARFHLVALAGGLVTVTVATAANSLLDYRLAQLAGIAVGSGLNFALNFLWTWR